jgi:hypothetical protein
VLTAAAAAHPIAIDSQRDVLDKLFAAFPRRMLPPKLDEAMLINLLTAPLEPVVPVPTASFQQYNALCPGLFMADDSRTAVGLLAKLVNGLEVEVPIGPISELAWLPRWAALGEELFEYVGKILYFRAVIARLASSYLELLLQ